MARARNIKPGFFKNEDLAECSIWARYIFPGLWMLADREGRLEDRPKRIKGELLPFDSQDVEPLLKELATRGFIIRYQIDGGSFIQISKFKEHQSPHYSEKASVIKPHDFREKQPDLDDRISEKHTPIKRGSKPPDSLIPDSLIPDSPKKTAPRASRMAVMPEGVNSTVWQDFIAQRKAKDAPLTETALAGIVREAEKAEISLEAALRICCERGWQSFKAEWLNKSNGANGNGNNGKEKFNVHAYTRNELAKELAAASVGAGTAQEVQPALPGEICEFIPRSGNGQ